MRKHSVRKWLHAILDLLPVIILPIFAIYSHRHTIDSYDVTVSQNEVVDFNQLIMPLSVYDNSSGLDVEIVNDYQFTINGTLTSSNLWFNGGYSSTNVIGHIHKDHIYLGSNFCLFYEQTIIVQCPYNSGYLFTATDDYDITSYRLTFFVNGTEFENELLTFQLVDLTQMFGSGNEPTIEQFNTWYPNDYYEYNTGTKQLLKGVSTVTYDNSDIGSQMMYSLYKPINDYFNLNNVFNFGAIYDWFELNMFNGNAPLSIFIVWNIIVYEFIMDIIFLIYSVFMFVIDFACETLDRFTGWAKRGD